MLIKTNDLVYSAFSKQKKKKNKVWGEVEKRDGTKPRSLLAEQLFSATLKCETWHANSLLKMFYNFVLRILSKFNFSQK